MDTQKMSRAFAFATLAVFVGSVSGCGLFDGYQREHHFQNDGSSALILDAKQRVLTQRKVDPDPDFQGKVKTGIVVCAEPSPDVANALSSALSTSLNAALPSAAGGKNFSADLSLSKAESIVQLGSRIATIQLLRDELADLCRSYSNGAVTATTYTLRLSRLDKKMVTLLLSEAAGRPASTQSVILGNSAAGTKPAASAEEISKARQAVIDASDTLVTKEKELKDAAEADKKSKQAERDDALKALQDKQMLLLALERRVLDTSTSADVQTVVLNSAPTGPNAGETLIALQDNFLLQDDLATFLDACISSLDLLQRPLRDEERALLATQRAVVEQADVEVEKARRIAAEAKVRFLERTKNTGDGQQIFDVELASAESAYDLSQVAAANARERYREAVQRLQPISRFGQYCQDDGLRMIVDANVQRITARRELLQARRDLITAQTHDTALRVCESSLKNANVSEQVTKACATALAARAESLAANTEGTDDDLSVRTAERRTQ
jgi:hypothetical protein